MVVMRIWDAQKRLIACDVVFVVRLIVINMGGRICPFDLHTCQSAEIIIYWLVDVKTL